MLDQLRLRVAELIRPKLPADAIFRPAAPDPSSDAEASFVQRLREIVATSGTALAGRINLLGLGHIKTHFGGSWQRVADRAERIARNAIERRLSPRDIYGKWDDFDFVLILADLSPAAAQVKCALIAQEIARVLIGEEGAELIEVKSAVVRLDGELDFESVPVKGALLKLLNHSAQPKEPRLAGSRDDPDGEPSADPLAGLRFRYRPLWDPVHHNAVLSHCVPLVGSSESGDVCRPAEFVVGDDPGLKARVDVAARQAALVELKRLGQQDRRLMLIVPVHFDSLAKLSARIDYMNALDELGTAEKRLVLFELIEVPQGVVYSRLFDLIAPLRSRCYGVVARVDIDRRDFAAIKEAGLRAVGADLPAHAAAEEALIRQAQRFHRAAYGAGLVAYLHGVHSAAVVQALRGGFAYLSGDAIAPLTDAPARIPALDFAGA